MVAKSKKQEIRKRWIRVIENQVFNIHVFCDILDH